MRTVAHVGGNQAAIICMMARAIDLGVDFEMHADPYGGSSGWKMIFDTQAVGGSIVRRIVGNKVKITKEKA